MTLSLDTAYRSFGGEVEASSTPTICRLPDSRRHQLSAIAPQCLNNITPSIGQQACNRVNLVANTSTNNSWVNSPPAPKPNANEVKYIGRGIGSVDGVNLCTMAHDLRLRT